MRGLARLGVATGLPLLAAWQGALAQPTLHGFVQANYAFRATGEECPQGMACDVIRAEERLQLKFEASSSDGRAGALARVDLFHDAIRNDASVDFREGYMDLATRRFSARIGRQVVTWGLGDLLFINDVFPKDWNAFLSGAPLEYLKLGSDALKLGVYPGSTGAEAVITPVFTPDRTPIPDRLFFFDPMPSVVDRMTERPTVEFKDMQLAGRLYARLGRYEVAAYASRGFFGMPGARFEQSGPGRLVFFYPRLVTYGGSLQGPLGIGVFSVEGGYYDSRDDPSGTDPGVENSQGRWLAAYQFQPREDLTLALQYYGELMAKHRSYLAALPPAQARDRYRQVASVRFTLLRWHQTLRWGLLVMGSPTDRDLYLNPSVRYSVSDELWVEIGGNIFRGAKPHTFFGQFEKNTALLLAARYGF